MLRESSSVLMLSDMRGFTRKRVKRYRQTLCITSSNWKQKTYQNMIRLLQATTQISVGQVSTVLR